MIYVVDNLVELVIELSALHLAGILRALAAIEANLRSNHGRRFICTNTAVSYLTRLGIQTRRNICRKHNGRKLVDGRNPDGEGRTDLAMKTRAQDGVDYQVCTVNKLSKLIARRTNNHVNVTGSCPASNVARQRAGNLARINRCYHINRNALVLQNICSDPAIAAVVAKTAQHQHVRGLIFLGKRGQKLAGMFHELSFRGAFTLNDILKSRYFLSIQNRLHSPAPVLPRYSVRAQAHPKRFERHGRTEQCASFRLVLMS